MKAKLLLAIVLAILLIQWGLSGCFPDGGEQPGGQAALKAWYAGQTDSLLGRLDSLDRAAAGYRPLSSLQRQFAVCRFNYKKIEAISEYYFQGLTQRVNGPALPDVRPEDGAVWPPHGFQVIEQLLYGGYADSLQGRLSAEIRQLQTDLRFMRSKMAYQHISAGHVAELVQHQLIRVAALGITGYDAPLSKLSLPEAEYSLYGIRGIVRAYTAAKPDKTATKAVDGAIRYLRRHHDFDSFDRLEFLCGYLMPLSDAFSRIPGLNSHIDSTISKPFRGALSQLLKGGGFHPDAYAEYAAARSNTAKVALGKKLFADNRLSGAGNISCAGCHQPERYFTDGCAKAADFVHGGSLPRNTPTLFYAALQSRQFYDLRSVTLEDQADAVMNGPAEFNSSPAAIARRLSADSGYRSLFRQAFGMERDSLGGFELRNALAAYVRTLSPFASDFDAYMRGDRSALTAEQVLGFNLFAGKAKCATCHFIPIFNGTVPPWFSQSESEVIGVPAGGPRQSVQIDRDSGRYLVRRFPEWLFSFKTPTLRNVARTAPYMHNGVYKTLDEVVEFYRKGGGAGLGIALPGQTLPFDSLALDEGERRAIVRFMESLTDRPRS
jgi:cytochrome c peroxidase